MRLRCYQLKVIFPCMKTYSLNVIELHLKRIWHNNNPVIFIMWKKLYKASFNLYIANAVAEKRIYVIDFFPLNIIGGKFRLPKKCMQLKSANRVTFKATLKVLYKSYILTVSHLIRVQNESVISTMIYRD